MKQEYLNLKTQKTGQFQNQKTMQVDAKLSKCIQMMSNETKFKFWIKTLISSYSTLPEIIKTVDKIIEIQASSVSFASDIYNKNKGTFNQVEKVIDLTERKNSLLNIYIMTKKMTEQLTNEHYEFLERKFIYNWSSEELANYYEISLRTVYRKIDKIIDEIFNYCTKHKWTLNFIETQVKEEGWLKEKYLKFVNDYYKNSNYKTELVQNRNLE